MFSGSCSEENDYIWEQRVSVCTVCPSLYVFLCESVSLCHSVYRIHVGSIYLFLRVIQSEEASTIYEHQRVVSSGFH